MMFEDDEIKIIEDEIARMQMAYNNAQERYGFSGSRSSERTMTKYRVLMDALEKVLAERDAALAQVTKWISVDDMLPETDEWVAVWYRDKDGDYFPTAGVYRDGGDGFTYWETDVDCSERAFPPEKITHWMPLPEPAKEES